MTLKDDDLLRSFAGNARCEICNSYGPVCGHHYWIRRGCGGGTRIDQPFNLIAVCSTPGKCHDAIHFGSPGYTAPKKRDMLKIVADRESVPPDTIVNFLAWLARQDKGRSVGPQGGNR